MDWIVQNIGSLLVGGVLLMIVGVVIYRMRKDKKAGKSSCGCNCSGCPMGGKCHEKSE